MCTVALSVSSMVGISVITMVAYTIGAGSLFVFLQETRERERKEELIAYFHSL